MRERSPPTTTFSWNGRKKFLRGSRNPAAINHLLEASGRNKRGSSDRLVRISLRRVSSFRGKARPRANHREHRKIFCKNDGIFAQNNVMRNCSKVNVPISDFVRFLKSRIYVESWYFFSTFIIHWCIKKSKMWKE